MEAKLNHRCMLEELIFWTLKYEFPQKIVTWLLSNLPDETYKVSHFKRFGGQSKCKSISFITMASILVCKASVAPVIRSTEAVRWSAEQEIFGTAASNPLIGPTSSAMEPACQSHPGR